MSHELSGHPQELPRGDEYGDYKMAIAVQEDNPEFSRYLKDFDRDGDILGTSLADVDKLIADAHLDDEERRVLQVKRRNIDESSLRYLDAVMRFFDRQEDVQNHGGRLDVTRRMSARAYDQDNSVDIARINAHNSFLEAVTAYLRYAEDECQVDGLDKYHSFIVDPSIKSEQRRHLGKLAIFHAFAIIYGLSEMGGV